MGHSVAMRKIYDIEIFKYIITMNKSSLHNQLICVMISHNGNQEGNKRIATWP